MSKEIINTPPPFDPDKEKKAKEKKAIIAVLIVLVLIVIVGFFCLKAIVGALIQHEEIVETVKNSGQDYRYLDVEAEYVANQTLNIVDDPNSKQTIGQIKKGDAFYCINLAYVDEKEELWGELRSGWVLIRDLETNYAKENIVQTLDDSKGTLEIIKSANVYESPSTYTNIVKVLKDGETIQFTSIGEDQLGNHWYEVNEGWIQESDAKVTSESKEETSENTSDKEASEDKDSASKDEEEAYVLAKANYDMKIRKEANVDSSQVGEVKKGETLKIIETKEGANESLWGKIKDDQWVCLYDKEYDYFDEVEEEKEDSESTIYFS